MSAVAWLSLHSLTRESIEMQPIVHKGVIRDAYDCGCDVYLTSLTVRLCQYHQGYDDGIEALTISAEVSQ